MNWWKKYQSIQDGGLYYILCKICWKQRQRICRFKGFWTQECVSFLIITHYLIYIFWYTLVKWNLLTFKIVFFFNIIMFQLQILKNSSLVLAWYAIIQNLFNLETCSPAWCLIIAQIIAKILHKVTICASWYIGRPPAPDKLYQSHINTLPCWVGSFCL